MCDHLRLRNSGVFVAVAIIFLNLFTFSSLVSSDELLVVGETRKLNVTPTLEVKDSPGLKAGRTVLCDRIHIHGLERFKHMKKFPYSLKLIVNAPPTGGKTTIFDVCYHMNSSLAIGMCPHNWWKRVSNGQLVQTMSLFSNKIIDVRIAKSSNVSLEVSAEEDLIMSRIVTLIGGIALLASASTLSKTLMFYYISAMALGIIIVVVLFIFKGMKLLQIGRRSWFGLFIYGSLLGFGGFYLRYIPSLFHSLLTEMGIDEEIQTSVVMVLGVFLVLAGAWFGFWTVKKHVKTEDGSIDSSTSVFVSRSTRFIAAALILKNSSDLVLAGALIAVILILPIFIKITRLKFLLSIYKIPMNLLRRIKRANHYTDVPTASGYQHDSMNTRPDAFRNRVTLTSLSEGIRQMRVSSPSIRNIFPSSFHRTPGRRKLTKEEWKKVTEDSTKNAVKELVSSPGFGRWAAANTDRIYVIPREGYRKTEEQPRNGGGPERSQFRS